MNKTCMEKISKAEMIRSLCENQNCILHIARGTRKADSGILDNALECSFVLENIKWRNAGKRIGNNVVFGDSSVSVSGKDLTCYKAESIKGFHFLIMEYRLDDEDDGNKWYKYLVYILNK